MKDQNNYIDKMQVMKSRNYKNAVRMDWVSLSKYLKIFK